jgi:hypothetical protein
MRSVVSIGLVACAAEEEEVRADLGGVIRPEASSLFLFSRFFVFNNL